MSSITQAFDPPTHLLALRYLFMNDASFLVYWCIAIASALSLCWPNQGSQLTQNTVQPIKTFRWSIILVQVCDGYIFSKRIRFYVYMECRERNQQGYFLPYSPWLDNLCFCPTVEEQVILNFLIRLSSISTSLIELSL